ncbi:MFS transporter [Neobacillus cucumis]|uniref:MFS transporter n=1 Tax=Neobacillus cucumis TaxID=1740721 RepID=UPI00257014CD|nr:MFS transporter [Neobacillus cucumis]
MYQQESAKRNLRIMWFANFFVGSSMTMVLPFISLYIESMGNFSEKYVQHWAGLTFGITFVSAFIFSPIWGKVGDRFGRKKILIYSGVGMGTSILLMGFAHTVFQLFMLRFFMGFFSGFISMSQAYISTQTPKNIAGRVLGTLQTGSITGSLLGPMLGGVLADSLGYATSFKWTSISIFISAFLVIFTKEFRIEANKSTKSHYSSKEVLMHIIKNPVFLTVILLSSLEQIAHFSVQPILSLFVSDLHGKTNVAFYSGIAFSAAGLGNLMMTKRWGKISDKYGYTKILIILLLAAGLIYLPGAAVTQFWQLVIIRFVLGVLIGGVVPTRIAYIRQEAPIAMQGEVLGYNTSFRFFGNIIGPMLGGFISGTFGYSAVFISTSALLIISGLILFAAVHYQPKLLKHTA